MDTSFTQGAVIRKANVGMHFVLLAHRIQMTLAPCRFAHRAEIIASGWFDVDPTP